ncbi:MAG: ABC transporter ATP-binding protein [Trueperaceae bacterium]|nr:ABC transporter ATP-binding protein [Trueperaceae bacterium]
MAVLAAHGLVKRYGRALAVDHVDLHAERGEIVGFLGPNGAGKTTTLRMLAGLIRPDDGTAEILGERVPGPTLRRVGTMIEEPSFYPYLSGRANLHYAATLHGGVPPARIDEVLAFVDMTAAASKRVRAYSQGMRQRLGLARALLHRPDVLLLDEPSNGLDPVGIAEIRENLRAVAQGGVTIVVSSHILAEIEKLVDRVVAIQDGAVRFDGPLDDLLHRVQRRTVTLRLSATDPGALRRALADDAVRGDAHLGAATGPDAADVPPPGGPDAAVRVDVAQADVPDLLRRLLGAGVEVTEARTEGEDLEGAYLRLLDRTDPGVTGDPDGAADDREAAA